MQKKKSIFYPYHPFATFARKDSKTFLDSGGEPALKGWVSEHSPVDNPDIAVIFDVAEDAFKRLTQDPYDGKHGFEHSISSPEEFDNAVAEGYVYTIDDLMGALQERINEGGVKVLAKHGGHSINPEDMANSSNAWKVRLLWHFLGHVEDRSEIAPLFRTLFLLATLEAAGDVLVSMCFDRYGQAEAMSGMHDCYYTALAIEADYLAAGKVKKQVAKRGAAAKLANDPKQHAKENVYRHWLAWQAGTESHEGQAAFARAMLAEWSNVLKSQPSIEAWCRQWKKGENIPLTEPAQ